MPIISENQYVKSNIAFVANHLELEFPDDPSHALAEEVLVDLPHRSIGVIVANALHYVGDLPPDIKAADIKAVTRARLHAKGAGGRTIELYAPVRIVSQ